jgi:hypothetical protein
MVVLFSPRTHHAHRPVALTSLLATRPRSDAGPRPRRDRIVTSKFFEVIVTPAGS